MEITPITVTELNQYMKNKVAEDEFLQNVYIQCIVNSNPNSNLLLYVKKLHW